MVAWPLEGVETVAVACGAPCRTCTDAVSAGIGISTLQSVVTAACAECPNRIAWKISPMVATLARRSAGRGTAAASAIK